MEQIFIQLGLIFFIAFAVSYILKVLKQPLVIGYILAGVVASLALGAGIISLDASSEIINLFSKLGVALLLFMVGLHMNPKVIKDIGLVSMLVGFGQIAITFLLGLAFCYYLLDFEIITSVYIAIALTFSSTIIVMKLLSDKRSLDSFYGKISVGVLIIQDLVAIFVLMFISSTSGGLVESSSVLKNLISGGLLVWFLFFAGYFILPHVIKKIAESQELLFLFSICWCFVLAALFSYFGFSIEIGALLAGVILSISQYSIEISSKVKPLRDFFLIVFFIILGLNISFSDLGSILAVSLILSAFVLLLKPIIIMWLMAAIGYTKKINFMVGTSLAQISEFSLIILAFGVANSQVSPEILSMLTLTGIITIALSTYMTIYSNAIYQKISKVLFLFEKGGLRKGAKMGKNYDAILFGYNRIGFGILESFKKMKKNYLVVDFNPDTIEDLSRFKIPCVYGDVYDSELLRELPLKKMSLAVSTIPDFETNLLLLENIKKMNPNAIVVLRAHSIHDALELYKQGASYVLTPHFLGGEYIAHMIIEDKTDEKRYKSEREKHIRMLGELAKKGHEHPNI